MTAPAEACPGPVLAGHELDLSGAGRRAIFGVLPGVWVTAFLGTVFDVGKADLVDALHADRYRMVWFAGTYLFGSATGLAATSFFAARVGFLIVGALIAFAMASGLCTLAPTVEAMAPFSLLAGFASGLVLCAGMLVLWRAFRGDNEVAMTVYGIGVYLSSLAGIVTGGLLLYWTGSWRLLLWMQVPLGLVSAWLAARYIVHDDPKAGTSPPRFDYWGMLFFSAFVATMIGALYFGHYWGWFISPYFAPWGLGWLVSTAAFVGWGFFAARPLINLRPLTQRNFGLGLVVKALLAINLFVLTWMLSSYMIELRGYQWWQTALVFLPALITAAFAMLAGARWGGDRSRRGRIFVGVLITALMTFKLAESDLYTSKFVTTTWLAIWGAGFGIAIGPTMFTVFYGLPKEVDTSPAGVFNIFRMLPVFFVNSLLVIALTTWTDTEFHRLRKDIIYERPLVTETVNRLAAQAGEFGNDSPRVHAQPHAMLGHWVHKNARVFALEEVLRLLALITALNLLLIPWLYPPNRVAANCRTDAQRRRAAASYTPAGPHSNAARR